MLYLYTGTDREKARSKMSADIAKIKGANMVRITDANSIQDLQAVLQGGGMFGGNRILVFEGVCVSEELRDVFLEARQMLAESDESVFVYEEKPLADVRKKLEKVAKKSERFDAAKKAEDKTIFSLANALRRRDRKALWVGYMKEIAKGSKPEAIHGILFWAAKSAYLSSKNSADATLVSGLAELPHAARRNGVELEYALERFVLSAS